MRWGDKLKKILFYVFFTLHIFAKTISLSVGIENPGKFKTYSGASNINPKIDIDYTYYFNNRFGFGTSVGLNYINIDEKNYLLTTSVSCNTALKIIENEQYTFYALFKIGYPYDFVTFYHNDSDLVFIKPILFHELSFGILYNSFILNLAFSSTYINANYTSGSSEDRLDRISINGGVFVF